MAKIFLTVVGSAFIGLCSLQAQQQQTDTTGTASESGARQRERQQYDQSQQDPNQSRGDRWQQQSDRDSDAYANEGMVIIEKSEIPASLRETLKDEKYSGWENGTIYHNSNTGEYVIAPRAYRFDKSGQEIEMENTGRESRYGGQQGERSAMYPDRTRESAEDAARDQMGEIPTSASEDQSDTTQSNYDASPQSQQQPDSQSQAQTDNMQQAPSTSYRSGQGVQYDTEKMTEIQAEQIPATLRRTLSERKYEGWEEKGTLYQDPSTNEYVLVMNKSEDSSQPRAYRFDKNGQLKEDPDQP